MRNLHARNVQFHNEEESEMDAMEDDLNDAEMMYYTEVMLRCSQKMIQAAQ